MKAALKEKNSRNFIWICNLSLTSIIEKNIIHYSSQTIF